MKALHAVALALCAVTPTAWLAVLVLLLVAHGGSVLPWSREDWVLMLAVLVVPLPLAAGLLRLPAPQPRLLLGRRRRIV